MLTQQDLELVLENEQDSNRGVQCQSPLEAACPLVYCFSVI
jgi:hypothetical protein